MPFIADLSCLQTLSSMLTFSESARLLNSGLFKVSSALSKRKMASSLLFSYVLKRRDSISANCISARSLSR